MRRVLLSLGVACLIGAALALSGPGGTLSLSERGAEQAADKGPGPWFQFDRESRNPVSHLRWNLERDDFQFAIVSDRTGSHRANIFSQAIDKLNLLQPEFVLSVGDLIEGAKKTEQLTAQWREFDGFASKLTMPFFYVAGNHDVASAEMTRFWNEKLGRRHYHFVYRGVLFLILNSDDPPDSKGGIGKEQVAYAQKALADNAGVRWTVVVLHRPLWAAATIARNGWLDVERALEGRRYTVFCGHVHRYQKYVRNGMNYYQLATTGGGSLLRGTEVGEFDHIVWVTMKKDGPVLANLMIDAIHSEDLQTPKTTEPGKVLARKPVHPARGQVLLEGVPVPGAQVLLQPAKGGVRAEGFAAADGSFTLTTYKAGDGAVAGEYTVTVVWRLKDSDGKLGPNQLPPKYAAAATSGLRASIREEKNELVLELTK